MLRLLALQTKLQLDKNVWLQRLRSWSPSSYRAPVGKGCDSKAELSKAVADQREVVLYGLVNANTKLYSNEPLEANNICVRSIRSGFDWGLTKWQW